MRRLFVSFVAFASVEAIKPHKQNNKQVKKNNDTIDVENGSDPASAIGADEQHEDFFFPTNDDLYGHEQGYLNAGWEHVKKALPITWTLYGHPSGSDDATSANGGPIFRAMVLHDNSADPPFLKWDTVDEVPKLLKDWTDPLTGNIGPVERRFIGRDPFDADGKPIGGTKADPHFWPVDIYEIKMKTMPPVLLTGANFAGRKMAPINPSPEHIGLLGDTGLRVKTVQDGHCDETDKDPLFGVNALCTKPKAGWETIDYSTEEKVTGDFQPFEEWPVDAVNHLMSHPKEKVDLVLHMGDLVYRQWVCPYSQGCKGLTKLSAWGDNVISWYFEMFRPFKSLLDRAPWMIARGNHEICNRAGAGWTLIASPDDIVPVTGTEPSISGYKSEFHKLPAAGVDGFLEGICPMHHSTFHIQFRNGLSVSSMDSSNLQETTQTGAASIDSYDFKNAPACAGTATEMKGDTITLKLADNFKTDGDAVTEDKFFAEQFSILGDLQTKWRGHQHSADAGFNILLTHTPVYAVVCDGPAWIGYNANMRNALQAQRVHQYHPQIITSGHMHWYQRWTGGKPATHTPTQFVIGNSGTRLIPQYGMPHWGTKKIQFEKKPHQSKSRADHIVTGNVGPYTGTIAIEFGFSHFRYVPCPKPKEEDEGLKTKKGGNYIESTHHFLGKEEGDDKWSLVKDDKGEPVQDTAEIGGAQCPKKGSHQGPMKIKTGVKHSAPSEEDLAALREMDKQTASR